MLHKVSFNCTNSTLQRRTIWAQIH